MGDSGDRVWGLCLSGRFLLICALQNGRSGRVVKHTRQDRGQGRDKMEIEGVEGVEGIGPVGKMQCAKWIKRWDGREMRDRLGQECANVNVCTEIVTMLLEKKERENKKTKKEWGVRRSMYLYVLLEGL